MITKYDKLRSGHCQVRLGDDDSLFERGNLSPINATEATQNVQFSALYSKERFEELNSRLLASASNAVEKCLKAIAYSADGRAKEKDCYADI